MAKRGMPKTLAAVLLASALALVAAACSSDDSSDTTTTSEATTPIQVAFVHATAVEEKGWTWTHDQGAAFLEENLPGAEVTTRAAVSADEARQVFEELAAAGNELIFGTSPDYTFAIHTAAQAYPDAAFMHAAGSKIADNVGTYFGVMEEGRYLAGIAAGEATESGLIGYVASFPDPVVIRDINGFMRGVQEVNEDAQVQVVWTNTIADPDAETAAAQELIDAGADVLTMHQDSDNVEVFAEGAGVPWVGHAADMAESAPTLWLMAPIWNWGPYFVEVAEDVRDGSWEPEVFSARVWDRIIEVSTFGPQVSAATVSRIVQRQRQMIDRAFRLFPDPIIDQEGNERPLGEIFDMDYFVWGVIGDPTGG